MSSGWLNTRELMIVLAQGATGGPSNPIVPRSWQALERHLT